MSEEYKTVKREMNNESSSLSEKGWGLVYALVLVFLVVLIFIFYFITEAYR